MTSLETSLAIGDIVKITAQSNNTFSPDSVTAREGDVLEFHFQARNHSVVAGDYKYPCYPAPMNTGFFSGFVDVASGEAVRNSELVETRGRLMLTDSCRAKCSEWP